MRRSICLYTPSVDPSGMGAHMLDLAAEYAAEADVSVLCWATVGGERVLQRAVDMGIRALPLPPPRHPSFAETITDFLAAHRVDVFHIHVSTGRENWDGARAARRSGVPVVVQTQHLPWQFSSRRKRVPFFRAIEPVGHLIAVSEGVRETYERIGVPSERITTVPNGVRPRPRGAGRQAARAAIGLGADRLVVMTVGRLEVMKAQGDLVDTVPALSARFPNLSVVIVGEGHLKHQLAERAAALGVTDYIQFTGHRPDARMLLDAADVFVLPSLNEGMPLALIEAMDAGLPVVATRAIGSAEVVDDGVTGRLVPMRNPEALAAALADLLADESLRASYGRAGRRRYLEHFTAQRMAAQTIAVYDKALEATGAPSMGAGR